MRRMKRVSALVLTAAMSVSMLQTGVAAVESSQVAIQKETQVFDSFVQAGTKISDISFVLGQDISELIAQMPETLTVRLTDGTVAEIPVTWMSLGDYEHTDDFYYEFIPQWDMHTYAPSRVLDSATDVPYVVAHRTEVQQNGMYRQENYAAIPKNANIVFDFLVNECGYNTAAACGVLANIEAESNFRPDCGGDGGTSYGICQWHNERFDAMKNWCIENGYDWKSLDGQLHYLKKELSANTNIYLWNGKTINNYMLDVSNTADGAYDGGYYWCYEYERPADKEKRSQARGNTAKNKYWEAFKDEIVSGTPDRGEQNNGLVYNIFADIKAGDWYCPAVQFVYDKGLMTGVTDTTFCPKDSINRAMSTVMLHSLSKQDKRFALKNVTPSGDFEDVWYGSWFRDSVRWANGAGLVSGYNDREFRPMNPMQREQFVAVLYNYAKKLGWNVSANASLSEFKDGGSVTAYAVPAMKWAVSKGLICGDKGALKPKASLNRAEAAVVMQRFVSLAK